jgi:hypothetical protein
MSSSDAPWIAAAVAAPILKLCPFTPLCLRPKKARDAERFCWKNDLETPDPSGNANSGPGALPRRVKKLASAFNGQNNELLGGIDNTTGGP